LYYRQYLIIDIFSRKVVGWEVWETESNDYAQILISRAVLRENILGKPLVLHSDNGSPMKAATFQTLLEALGITKSYSRPRVSNDNPYSESLFRTCKYRPGYPEKGFGSLEAARSWVRSFVAWYNGQHLHSGISFVTPNDRHTGRDVFILADRKRVYEQAKERRPERWARGIRKWEAPAWVALGPVKESEAADLVAT